MILEYGWQIIMSSSVLLLSVAKRFFRQFYLFPREHSSKDTQKTLPRTSKNNKKFLNFQNIKQIYLFLQ